jgi:hypothetical protein
MNAGVKFPEANCALSDENVLLRLVLTTPVSIESCRGRCE